MRCVVLFFFLFVFHHGVLCQDIGLGAKVGVIQPHYMNADDHNINKWSFTGSIFGDLLFGRDMISTGISFASLKHTNTLFDISYEYQYFSIPLNYNRFVLDWLALTGGLQGDFIYRLPDGITGSDFKNPTFAAVFGGRLFVHKGLFVGANANMGLSKSEKPYSGARLITYSFTIGLSPIYPKKDR